MSSVEINKADKNKFLNKLLNDDPGWFKDNDKLTWGSFLGKLVLQVFF